MMKYKKLNLVQNPAWSLGLFLLAGLLGMGCEEGDRRPPANGLEGTITVVVDSTTWRGPIGEAIRAELGQDIETLPIPEPAFRLERLNLNPQVLDKIIKKKKYVLFAAALDEQTSVGEFMRASLDSASAQVITGGRSVVIQRPDLWYRKQLVVYATGPSPEAVAAELRQKGETLRYAYNIQTRHRLTEDMFRRKRQTEKEAELMAAHDFAVNVQHDYFLAQDTLYTKTEKPIHFIRMRRVLTDTWREIFVAYIENGDPSDITPEWIIATRDSLTEAFVRGTYEDSYVMVDQRRPLESENINFLDRFAYETRALWRMTGDAMGGPIVNYTFYDEAQRRIYMIDGMVFAPKYDKREFLRQMEVIAYTFRTQQDEAATALANARD